MMPELTKERCLPRTGRERSGPDHTAAASRPPSVGAAYDGSENLGEARALATGFLETLRSDGGVDVCADTEILLPLVVSELVTNVHRYAPGPHLVELTATDGHVEVSVWDTDPVLPTARECDPKRVGGHGLEIVVAVCSTFRMRRESVGKRVTATLPLRSDDAPPPVATAARPGTAEG